MYNITESTEEELYNQGNDEAWISLGVWLHKKRLSPSKHQFVITSISLISTTSFPFSSLPVKNLCESNMYRQDR